jgi:hypothetical protein
MIKNAVTGRRATNARMPVCLGVVVLRSVIVVTPCQPGALDLTDETVLLTRVMAKGHHTQSLPRHRDVTDTVSLAGDCSANPVLERTTIQVEAVTWSPGGQLDWWVKERREWRPVYAVQMDRQR